MLLFSIFNSSIFGIFSDSALHRFETEQNEELKKIQDQITESIFDNENNLFSIQNICKVAKEEYACEPGNYYSPIGTRIFYKK